MKKHHAITFNDLVVGGYFLKRHKNSRLHLKTGVQEYTTLTTGPLVAWVRLTYEESKKLKVHPVEVEETDVFTGKTFVNTLVLDPKDLVRNPSYATKPYPFNQPPGGCWGVIAKGSATLMEKLCLNSARPGRLTCRIHDKFEQRARLLRKAQGSTFGDEFDVLGDG